MIILYIVEEKIFVVIVYILSFTEGILKRHIKDCLKIICKQTIKMPKKDKHVKFKNFERKIKLPY